MSRTTWMTLLMLIAGNLTAIVAGQQPASKSFSKDQLEQMVAPVALYPDSLISSVLMASTYPLEVVEADRWVDSHKDLKGDALTKALKDEDWDPAVKSIVTVPEVLKRMSQNLDWTRDLGDAFLGQQAEVMAAVQKMRGKANEAGNLKSGEQQNVTVNQDQTIVIESTSPEVCYVPEYSTAVYGGGYSYPEPYYGYMYPAGWGLLAFGTGAIVGGALWGNANWGGGDININNGRYNNWNNQVNHNWQNSANGKWGHNVDHRKGVGYRDNKVAQKYGGAGGSNRVSSDRARGRASQLPANNRPGGGAGGGQRPGGDRPGAGGGGGQRPGGDRPGAGAGGGQRPSGDRPGAGGGQRPSGGTPSQRPSTSQRPSGGYSGASQPRADRAASNRGNSSRGMSSGSRGGGGRGGGGRGGGRGGRR